LLDGTREEGFLKELSLRENEKTDPVIVKKESDTHTQNSQTFKEVVHGLTGQTALKLERILS
jgi:hypothetical protein